MRLPPDRLCNLVYYWLVSGLDERKRREFDERLHRPPADAATDADVWGADDEMAAFRQAQQAVAGV